MNLVILKARNKNPDSDPWKTYSGGRTPIMPQGHNPWDGGVPVGAAEEHLHPTHAKDHGLVLAKYHDVLGPDGKVLPFVPIFADRMKAGLIRDIDGIPYYGHGGPGFPALPQFRGKWAWANLPDGKGAKAYQKLSQKHPHGFVGMIYVGAHGASAGNRAYLEVLKHHLDAFAGQDGDSKRRLNEFMKTISRHDGKGKGYEDVNDFYQSIKGLATTTRAGFLNTKVLGRGGGSKEEKAFLQALDLPASLMHFNDYHGVPTDHAVALIRVPHNAKIEKLDNGHPVYPWHIEGSYLGELSHSVPLSEVAIHAQSGVRPHQSPTGASVMTGGENAEGGPMQLGVMGMHVPHQIHINTTGIESGRALAKSLDNTGELGYTESEVPTMAYPKVHPEVESGFRRVWEADHKSGRARMDEKALETVYQQQAESPEVQAKITQRIARKLPK
jgi:hypothetical protein